MLLIHTSLKNYTRLIDGYCTASKLKYINIIIDRYVILLDVHPYSSSFSLIVFCLAHFFIFYSYFFNFLFYIVYFFITFYLIILLYDGICGFGS